MSDCLFCKIVAGEIPSTAVLKDEHCYAFMDIRPINPGHVLVIPVRHAANLAELDAGSGAEMFKSAQKIAAAVRASGLDCEGINLHLADGPVAGQEVFHVHLHVIPRFSGDGFGLKFPPDYQQETPLEEEIQSAAARITAALE